MHWGHKASVIGLPKQGIPLDAVAISDAATHDGETLYPHVEKLFNDHPEIKPWIDTILYDSACDSKPLKDKFQKDFAIDLKTSFNPRGKKDVTEGLPPGIEKITPYGVPICIAGYEMDYKGIIRYEAGKFIYQASTDDNKITVCLPCEHKINCCPNSNTGRIINISFDVIPQINSDDPPMAKRFKAILSRRTSISKGA
ncbi:transposase IS4 family protein [Candidatus Magnetobacterium bavaricum]|uniref:Transposase IS4 family protein n=1 Tax=Candidatus Magnetobacterium bavaricum TaxID=29290 RepID=A0A0F3GW36_9BACT|nr:transposase IS4 family protein [Candidatus Magnetobacterium bavaricum]